VADEVNRKTSTRRIKNPDGDGAPSDADVIVEVIDEISFIDPSRQYQQFTWAFDNSEDSSRQVHAVTVIGSDSGDPAHAVPLMGDDRSSISGSTVDVERVDQYKVIDPTEQHQETWTTLDNASEDRFAVDYVPSGGDNRETHDVKIHSKDGSAWLLIRRTDAFTIAGGADEQYWETEFSLDNKDADAGDPAPTDLADPTTDWDGTTINPPWRLDPFQNIVDVSWSGLAVVFYDGAA
jgi:hypothetical protein